MKNRISNNAVIRLLKETFSGFFEDNVMRLSSSLAYYTIFSVVPLLLILIYFLSIFFAQAAVEGKIVSQLAEFLGRDNAAQLQDIIKNVTISTQGPIAVTIGVIVLVFGATTVFNEIQNSINFIWGIKPKPKKGWLKLLVNRLLSFSLIISFGFLLVVSLIVTSLIDASFVYLQNIFPDFTIKIFFVINQIITWLIVTAIFAAIFKVLPDAKIRWKVVRMGAIVTGVLFMIGKFLISFYIRKAGIGSIYGSAGMSVVFLVWAYYSSAILYFGAEFTKAYAIIYSKPIYPNSYAVTVRNIEVDEGSKSIQQNREERRNSTSDPS